MTNPASKTKTPHTPPIGAKGGDKIATCCKFSSVSSITHYLMSSPGDGYGEESYGENGRE